MPTAWPTSLDSFGTVTAGELLGTANTAGLTHSQLHNLEVSAIAQIESTLQNFAKTCSVSSIGTLTVQNAVTAPTGIHLADTGSGIGGAPAAGGPDIWSDGNAVFIGTSGAGKAIQLQPDGSNVANNQFAGFSGHWQTYDGSGSSRNILDDGSGNMTAAAALHSTNQIYPGSETAVTQSSGGILHSTGVPSNSNGNNNDWIISDNGSLYFKSASAWTQKDFNDEGLFWMQVNP